jgi:hypothetical protein
MTLKALLDAIQDSKITADVVVSDKGRLQPVTRIEANRGVVMLICRPRPNWNAEPATHALTVEALKTPPATQSIISDMERRISEQAGLWERLEVAKALAHQKDGQK